MENSLTEDLATDKLELPSDEWSEESKLTDDAKLKEDVPSPLQAAVPLVTDRSKQRYKNDAYLNEILMVLEENPEDDAPSCFYVSSSMMMFRRATYETVQFLRKKFAYLLNYERLITAREPELTMERLQFTLSKSRKTSEEWFRKWEALALRGGGRRIFFYLLSFIINHPIYVLDMSSNEWREYDLCCTNYEQSQFHCDLVRECSFDFIGPPFMIAEHLKMGSDGKLHRTHASAMMHKYFYNGNDDVLGIRDYISLLTSPEARLLGFCYVFPEMDSTQQDSQINM